MSTSPEPPYTTFRHISEDWCGHCRDLLDELIPEMGDVVGGRICLRPL